MGEPLGVLAQHLFQRPNARAAAQYGWRTATSPTWKMILPNSEIDRVTRCGFERMKKV